MATGKDASGYSKQRTSDDRQRSVEVARRGDGTLSQHRVESPSVWTLTLPGGDGQRERKVMMTRISPRYADSPWLAGRSDLWVFYEALVDAVKGQRTSLGVAWRHVSAQGGCGGAEREGYVRPAFAELVGRAH